MTTKIEEAQAKLAAMRARRRPVASKEEQAEAELVAKLEAELEAERVAVRREENEDICKTYASTKAFTFFDLDPDGVQPATKLHNGRECTIYTRFVVRAADGDTVREWQNGPPEHAPKRSSYDNLRNISISCLVYPVPVTGPGSAQHYLDLEASFHAMGVAPITLSNEALRLGGLNAAAYQAKS